VEGLTEVFLMLTPLEIRLITEPHGPSPWAIPADSKSTPAKARQGAKSLIESYLSYSQRT
jgi:hypothetical protein